MASVDNRNISQDCDLIQPQIACSEEVVKGYFRKFGEQNERTGLKKEAFGQSEYSKCCKNTDGSQLFRELGPHKSHQNTQPLAENHSRRAEDSDGEELRLCHQCALPLGDKAYRKDRKYFHGECMAQMVVHTMKDEEKAKQQEVCKEKQACRSEYGIGWEMRHIPRNEKPAGKLAMRDVPEGLVCLVLDQETKSITIASTTEPAASVNLEYLSTALEVRRREGHEPVFSLEPVDPQNRNSMQTKMFVPEWLAGTSTGEVLFQADYHLKELSMGEFEQPVVGMKSCFDHSVMNGQDLGQWNGREWFLVRKAEVHSAENNVLIPYVKMGVEAREQVIGAQGLEDKQITRPDHPMVKYAEAFTKNFDLIAERKSVIFHLRELAKASVLAKHLLDANIELDASWFQLVENDWTCSLEVPQLWNERQYSHVNVQDGTIVRDPDQKNSRVHGVYGGVMFGLDRFSLAENIAPATSLTQRVNLGVSSVGAAPMPLVAPIARSSVPAGKLTMMALSAAAPRITVVPGEPVVDTPVGPPPIAPQASVTTGKLAIPGRSAPSFAVAIGAAPAAQQAVPGGAPGAAYVAPDLRPTLEAAGMDKYSLSTAYPRPEPVEAALAAPKPTTVQATVVPQADVPVSVPQRDLAFAFAKKAPRAPVTSIAAMATGAAFVAPVVEPVISRLTNEARRAVIVPPGRRAIGEALENIERARAIMEPAPAAAAPQGVDLRLDNFDLSSTTRVSLEVQKGNWSGEAKSLDECLTVGTAFWQCLEDSSDKSREDDEELLKHIFNPKLSDRRREGELFVPPDASYSTVTRLRGLVKEEEKVRQRRTEHFFSKDFIVDNPGPLFPATWTPSFDIANGRAPTQELEAARPSSLQARPDLKAEAKVLLQHVLKTSVPMFDKITEEGMRFRIYQIGNLEVRETQDLTGEQTIGAVFSIYTPAATKDAGKRQPIQRERIAKATEYVERICVTTNNGPRFSCHYFVVFETENGYKIVTELSNDGKVEWDEGADNLEDRCSLAKVTRSEEPCAAVTVREMRTHRSTLASEVADAKVSASLRKRYARAVFNVSIKGGM